MTSVSNTSSAVLPPASSFSRPWPPMSQFKSLTIALRDALPETTKQHVEQYVLYRQVQEHPNQDISAMKQGALLTEDKVRGVSHCKDEDYHFFTSLVEAHMKKNVLYAVRTILDSRGMPVHSSCECPAGSGPHATCKHVVAGAY